jgi:hypothetical protein
MIDFLEKVIKDRRFQVTVEIAFAVFLGISIYDRILKQRLEKLLNKSDEN